MYKLAIVGFGVVGQGLAEILLEHRERLKKEHGFEYSVVAVSDFVKGAAYDPKGLDLAKLLALAKENGISQYPGAKTGWNAIDTIVKSNADVVVEATYTDIKTAEPAYSHFKAALNSGKHLVTTNKGPTALFFREVAALAKSKKVQFRYEGTVMSGTPALNLVALCLAGNEIREIRGIVNGTTNFILTNMEKRKSYADALKEAQDLGFAEAVPDADVEGFDAMAKVVILAKAVMGADLKVADVDRTGITRITLDDINNAKAEGKRWKLIGRVAREGGAVRASVRPEKLDVADPLAGVGGATNALTFSTDLIRNVTIIGPGAGKIETGYSILVDLLAINRTAPAARPAAPKKPAPKKTAKKAAKRMKKIRKRAKKAGR
ncbi:MAG: homoserine dehydrogenase [Candidatus Krumholzibacteria bacterium]|nr:homoserine dehydrogenase [Candidatus Krumholzibacteria bacterium]